MLLPHRMKFWKKWWWYPPDDAFVNAFARDQEWTTSEFPRHHHLICSWDGAMGSSWCHYCRRRCPPKFQIRVFSTWQRQESWWKNVVAAAYSVRRRGERRWSAVQSLGSTQRRRASFFCESEVVWAGEDCKESAAASSMTARDHSERYSLRRYGVQHTRFVPETTRTFLLSETALFRQSINEFDGSERCVRIRIS